VVATFDHAIQKVGRSLNLDIGEVEVFIGLFLGIEDVVADLEEWL